MYWSRQLRYPGTVPASESADFGSQAVAGAAFFHLLVLLCCAASLSFFHLFFFCRGAACGILVPQPGVKPMPFAWTLDPQGGPCVAARSVACPHPLGLRTRRARSSPALGAEVHEQRAAGLARGVCASLKAGMARVHWQRGHFGTCSLAGRALPLSSDPWAASPALPHTLFSLCLPAFPGHPAQ